MLENINEVSSVGLTKEAPPFEIVMRLRPVCWTQYFTVGLVSGLAGQLEG